MAETIGPVKGVTVETLRAIVRIMHTTGSVDFDAERGVTCPLCGHHARGKGLGVTRTMYLVGGVRERYHSCVVCGWRFKSVEK